jgi:hypothetical protein
LRIAHIATVHSDVGGDFLSDLPVEEVPADSRPLVYLMPEGQGLKLEMFVRPFGEQGPSHRPGAGGEVILAEVDGKRMRVQRDLAEERRRAVRVVEASPALEDGTQGDSRWVWALDDPETCLETLLALQELGEEVTLEWPQGGRMRVQAGSASVFQGAIRSQREWFSASGELRVDNDLVLNLRQLIELTEASAGRFVPLGEGRFLALTREFRRRLDELRFLGEVQGDEVRISPLAALAFEEASNGLGKIKTDKKWKEALSRVEAAMARTAPVPKTLQAELRDYQIEGFQWLDRLAHWGVGACLADDMGLGKTLQALALLLSRTTTGPALVVAPTSVCLNWVAEASRFAPTLNPIVFGAGDRKQTLEDLGPGDLLLVTYTLLQQEPRSVCRARVGYGRSGRSAGDQEHGHASLESRHAAQSRVPDAHHGHPDRKSPGGIVESVPVHQPRSAGFPRTLQYPVRQSDRARRKQGGALRLKKTEPALHPAPNQSQVLEECLAAHRNPAPRALSDQETDFLRGASAKGDRVLRGEPEGAGQKLHSRIG